MSGKREPPSKGKKTDGRAADRNPTRPGLPPQSAVLSELSLDSPKGNRYRILRTSEKDATDDDKDPSQ
jgi:hypothetical protein